MCLISAVDVFICCYYVELILEITVGAEAMLKIRAFWKLRPILRPRQFRRCLGAKNVLGGEMEWGQKI